MVSLEMTGIIINSVLLSVDLLTSFTSIIMSGNLEFECCCLKMKHKDIESELIQEIKEVRRMSGPPPSPLEPVGEISIPLK